MPHVTCNMLCLHNINTGGGTDRETSIYFHDLPIYLSIDAKDVSIEDILFRRLKSSVLVYRRGSQCEVKVISHLLVNAQRYDYSCCWKVGRWGIKRFPPGDSQHGLSETGTVFAIKNLTLANVQKENGRCPESIKFPEETIMVFSSKSIASLVAITSDVLRYRDVYYKIQEDVVHISDMQKVLSFLNLASEDFFLLFGMTGYRNIPCMRHLYRSNYIQAVFKFRTEIGKLFVEAVGIDLTALNEIHLLWSETLAASAFLLKRKAAEESKTSSLLRREKMQKGNWPANVRQ